MSRRFLLEVPSSAAKVLVPLAQNQGFLDPKDKLDGFSADWHRGLGWVASGVVSLVLEDPYNPDISAEWLRRRNRRRLLNQRDRGNGRVLR